MSFGYPTTPGEKFLQNLLCPVSSVFLAAIHIRQQAYKVGLMKVHTVPVPVISVGNISTGGTGKTPVTIDLAQRLIKQGARVAILSRGYRRLSRKEHEVVSDGRGHLASCAQSGDEPFMMARSLPQAVVIVGAKRAMTADIAVNQYKSDVILLDDGFQHWQLKRDLDLVLIDYHDDLLKAHLLPAGHLREPLSALNRANQVVITKLPASPEPEKLAKIKEVISCFAPSAEILSCRFQVGSLVGFGNTGQLLSVSELDGKPVLAFCGIARPEGFFALLQELNAKVVARRVFADHHWYCQEDLRILARQFHSSKAELVITTEKDSVRLDPCWADMPIYFPLLCTEWLDGLPAILPLICHEK